jgi:hypothetical protein
MCFTEFLRERQYLLNVSTVMLDWYKNAFKWLPSASPSQADLKESPDLPAGHRIQSSCPSFPVPNGRV